MKLVKKCLLYIFIIYLTFIDLLILSEAKTNITKLLKIAV